MTMTALLPTLPVPAPAEAGTALTDKEMADRLARVRGSYAFLAAGKYNLSGFLEPIEGYQLLRP